MERGTITFAILFLALPALLFVLAWAVPTWSIVFALLAVLLVIFGFTIVVPATAL